MTGLEPSDTAFAARHSAFVAEFETVIAGLFEPAALPFEIARPPRLRDAMAYGVLGGGKRLRPFLLVTAAAVFAANTGAHNHASACVHACALQAAAALECVHAYSLIHDDLPAMDDDAMRRGKPTVHKAFDEATAILAGDALLTLAFDVLSRETVHKDPLVRLALIAELARAAGVGGMAGGQMLDLLAQNAIEPLSHEAIFELQAMKTGALLTFAAGAGARIAGATPEEIGVMYRYGAHLGRAFQIRDDILDHTSNLAELGKAAGKDSAKNKATFVACLGLAGAKQLAAKEIAAANAILAALNAANGTFACAPLIALADFMLTRRM